MLLYLRNKQFKLLKKFRFFKDKFCKIINHFNLINNTIRASFYSNNKRDIDF